MNKEEIYDEQISPLIAQILAICKEHKVPMVAQFGIPTDGDPDLCCTSALLTDEYEPHPHMLEAFGVLKPGGTVAPMNLVTEDAAGNKTFTTIVG